MEKLNFTNESRKVLEFPTSDDALDFVTAVNVRYDYRMVECQIDGLLVRVFHARNLGAELVGLAVGCDGWTAS